MKEYFINRFFFQAPLFNLFKHRRYIYTGLTLGFALGLVLMVTPLGFPFREAVAAQRYTIWVIIFIYIRTWR